MSQGKRFDVRCSKCQSPDPPTPGARFARMITTAFRCALCGHWNDLKRRKGWAEYRATLDIAARDAGSQP